MYYLGREPRKAIKIAHVLRSRMVASDQLISNSDAKPAPARKQVQSEQPARPVCRASWRNVKADAALVKRCLKGEVAAWEELYRQCHPPLLRSIEVMLGPQQRDIELIDELAARVWYALVAEDGKLLGRFDAKRNARLSTFIRAVAKDIVCRYQRSELRRHQREHEACRTHRRSGVTQPDDAALDLAEFQETLTAGEREFLGEQLNGRCAKDEPVDQRSATSIWQLTSRIRRKLRRFLSGGR